MTTIAQHPIAAFSEGDQVVLAHGGNQGTPGVFVRLRVDARWADIMERNGNIKSHPVQWLARAADFKTLP